MNSKELRERIGELQKQLNATEEIEERDAREALVGKHFRYGETVAKILNETHMFSFRVQNDEVLILRDCFVVNYFLGWTEISEKDFKVSWKKALAYAERLKK